MQTVTEIAPLSKKIGSAMGRVAAALLCAAALGLPNLAYAGHGGGRGHGGGFHNGWHGGVAGFHHNGFEGHGGDWNHGWRGGYYGWGGGLGLGLGYPYDWSYFPPNYGYYDSSQPYATSQYWYYCSDPAGYYPYITQCNTGWQTVPAS